jgi:hypothetical protein
LASQLIDSDCRITVMYVNSLNSLFPWQVLG